MAVDDYLAQASLWLGDGGQRIQLAGPGELSADRLAEIGRSHVGRALYLQRVDVPLGGSAYRAWRRRPGRPAFRPSSRFAVVGLTSRMLDTLMRLSLVLRGKVPGGYTAAAQLAYESSPSRSRPVYYGHVSRDGGYLVLQYWYFYAMNDWRSTFGGVNDHEADWEQVTLFLTDEPEPVLRWVAFSSHDEVGDDLRRHADDPDIEWVGSHPVVYAGGGSHSGAYLRGEYLVTAGIRLPPRVERVRRSVLRVLPWFDPADSEIGIPYIDYRRGDGVSLGAGEDAEWTAVRIDDATPWVNGFRGLWGLDTRDPLGGERAPAGPRYERSQAIRASWGQPVSWAGLDKEAATDDEALRDFAAMRSWAHGQLAEVVARLEVLRTSVRGVRLAERSLGRSPRRPSASLRALQVELDGLRGDEARLLGQLELLDRVPEELVAGEGVPPTDAPHAHLEHRALPLGRAADSGRLLRVWSAASASLVLGFLGAVLLVKDTGVVVPFLIVGGVMIVIEATLRRRLLSLLLGVALAAFAGLVVWAIASLVVGNLRGGFGVLFLLAAAYMAFQTVQEGVRTRE